MGEWQVIVTRVNFHDHSYVVHSYVVHSYCVHCYFVHCCFVLHYLAGDRYSRDLHKGDHFVGVSSARHLLLQVSADGTFHNDFGDAWTQYTDRLVPPSIERIRDGRHAQVVWERAFNDGRPRPPRPNSIRVIGVDLVRILNSWSAF